jgi:enoyl-CoA hydratase/carnithine racemase
MAADLRLGKIGGGKVGLPEVTLGVLPGTGGTQRLARMLGKSKAIELMAKGSNFTMEEAAELGLINELLPAEEWWSAVLDYARQFVPPAKASMAVGRIKRSVQTGLEVGLEAGLALERELQQQLFQSDDAKEGIAAFGEKRRAVFKGS